MINTGDFKAVEIRDRDNSAVNFLYNTIPGRVLLKILIKPGISKLAGSILRNPATCFFIKGFIKRNNIDMNEYRDNKFKSFDDFFIRELKEGYRLFPDNENDVAAPGDGKLTVYPVTADSVFTIKNSNYSVCDLLGDKNLADEFSDGICLIFRLSPDDYHRYSYIDDGEIISHKQIDGVLHTVRPIAFRKFDVFCRNSREITVMQTKNFGKIIQIEVGALFVGKISNRSSSGPVKRGEEKGMFQFGGSTIILMFKSNIITVNDEIYENTVQNMETIVRMGDKIGEKPALK